MNKYYKPILIFLLVILSALAVKTAFEYHSVRPVDIRNRQVASRLIMEGKSPYFFDWKPSDGLRYYDPLENVFINLAPVTVTPAMCYLLAPWGMLSFYYASFWWTIFQLMCVVGVIVLFARQVTGVKKWLLITTGIIFLYSSSWLIHLCSGQVYIIYALLMAAFFTLMKKGSKYYFVAGLAAIVFTLLRPNAGLFLLPFFIPQWQKYRKLWSGALVAGSIFLLILLLFEKQQVYWTDYFKAMKQHTEWHRNVSEVDFENTPSHADMYPDVEGFDIKKVKAENPNVGVPDFESFNFIVIYKAITRKLLSRQQNNLLALFALGTLLSYILVKSAKKGLTLSGKFFAGILLYQTFQFFLPIQTNQYPGVVWLPMILVMLSQPFNSNNKIGIIGSILGLALLISNASWIPLRHSIGETILMGVCLWMVLIDKNEKNISTA